ncbi:MAG: HNH endonuclease [Ilumatobacteraceae bacterium]
MRRTQETHPSPTPQPTPCRLWQGASGSDGYGWRKVEGKPVSMHRWVMAQVVGRKLRPSEVVLHACDNPFCYRVDHLSIGTVRSNNDDMRAKGRATPPPVNVFHGECHPMAKLTRHQVRAIRGHRQSGLSVRTIAEMFEISPSTVRRICKGQTWAQFGDNQPKPPTRDLLAEARARLAKEAASAAEPAEPPKRIRPVKPIRKDR